MHKLIDFILENKASENMTEVIKALNVATIIIYDGRNCIISDDTTVYYLVCNESRFVLKNRDHLYNKIAYTKNRKLAETMGAEILEEYPNGRIKFRTLKKIHDK